MSYDGDRVVPILRQTWKSKSTIDLVYNFDSGMIRHFEEISVSDIAASVIAQAKLDVETTQRLGCEVKGIQIDFDCPTRLLSKYARLTRQLRAVLDRKLTLSATGLTSWIGRPGLAEMVKNLDFFVPQFYEGELPRRISDPKPLADLAKLESDLRELEKLPKPVWIGVPSYGQCLLYDESGSIAGMYRGLSRRDACRHPLMTFERTTILEGEEQTIFHARKDGKNYSLLYRVSTADLVTRFLRTIESGRPNNCVGAILFRVPAENDGMAVALSELRRSFRHEPIRVQVQATWQVRRLPFSAIETQSDLAFEAILSVKNTGETPIRFAPDALRVVVNLERLAQEASPGNFDKLSKTDPHVSLARTHSFTAVRSGLEPGETAILGPFIILKGEIEAQWSVLNEKNERIHGTAALNVGELD